MQFEPVLGLQVDHQLVGDVHLRIEDGVWRRAEVDHDAGVTPGQALASSDVERHAGPAPVRYLGAQGDKGFGMALRVDAAFVTVGRHGDAGDAAGRVLAANDVLRK